MATDRLSESTQSAFRLELRPSETIITLDTGPRSIEDDDFPFEALSTISELESWRKEINRPVYHVHKWWAQRLGTVFRAIVLGTFAPTGTNILDLFYRRARIPGAVVFDPFMGSGTTVGETLKLGARAIGRDINPVAHFLVQTALTSHDRQTILNTYAQIERDVADSIRHFYTSRLQDGTVTEVLYFFWVKQVDCPNCAVTIDLFPSYVIAKHAYPKRFPEAQAVCPYCGEINQVRFDADRTHCKACHQAYDPQTGPARGANARCPQCNHVFPVSKTIRSRRRPPTHRLFAKLVLLPDGRKAYEAATAYDHHLYGEALRTLEKRPNAFPIVPIEAGYNTNQALGYCYRYWHEMFNARQLLCLSILADRIGRIHDSAVRDLFACLLSGTLEFNNMFASYKGEGTGAVRPMFAHHILKPERVPLEANIWGTSKSSGSFSTLFRGRILRALDYANDPFELRVDTRGGRATGAKVFGLSEPLGFSIADDFTTFAKGEHVYLACGDSSSTDLPDRSVDAVITDPPFFDNVHYSQLADFFHVWQRFILGRDGYRESSTTRSAAEVQDSDAAVFARRLTAVLTEVHRVLKEEGLLVFTYHHSRPEGWRSILEAVMQSGFRITATHPIKAEMSVSMPKSQAKEPIDLDVIIVCRKRIQVAGTTWHAALWNSSIAAAESQVARLRQVGRRLSKNDVRVVFMAQLLRTLSTFSPYEALSRFDECAQVMEEKINLIHTNDAERRH